MTKMYTDEFLISKLQRFKEENGRVPKQRDMKHKFGYPSTIVYQNHFGSFNNALEIAKLPLNKTTEYRTGTETCCVCGNYKKHNQHWVTKGLQKGQVMCKSCYLNPDYRNGKLDKNSKVGKGFIAQRVVAKVLNIELKNDCNCSKGFGHDVDLYDKGRYNYINVKSSCLNNKNSWSFSLIQKTIPDTYIMVAFDEYWKNILHVWITNADDYLVVDKITKKRLTGKVITNIYKSLKKVEYWEVDSKIYDDVLHNMSLDNCSVLSNN